MSAADVLMPLEESLEDGIEEINLDDDESHVEIFEYMSEDDLKRVDITVN